MLTHVLKFSLKTSAAIISAVLLPFTIIPVVSESTPQVVSASVIVGSLLFWLPVFVLVHILDWFVPFSSHFFMEKQVLF